MNKTTNYNLNQWEAGDRVLRTDFNADNAKIDAAIKAETDARAALAGQVAKCGNCRIWTTTYVGTGGVGRDHPTSLTFPKKPLLALIVDDSGKPAWLIPGTIWFDIRGTLGYPSWSGNRFSWYVDETEPYKQMNTKDITYWVVALLAADK